jgi:signal transduction histidine kinase
LEAARRLLPLDRPQAEDKLAASQELARQGLEEIRKSVRLLREAPATSIFTEPSAR